MKANGYAEVSATLTRIRRLRALGRVAGSDCEYIAERLEEVQARITSMDEYDQHGDPIAG
jgi:DNA repair ATPase RecN